VTIAEVAPRVATHLGEIMGRAFEAVVPRP
jgi:hypothetical protein